MLNFTQQLKIHDVLLSILGEESFESDVELPDEFLKLFQQLKGTTEDVLAEFCKLFCYVMLAFISGQ